MTQIYKIFNKIKDYPRKPIHTGHTKKVSANIDHKGHIVTLPNFSLSSMQSAVLLALVGSVASPLALAQNFPATLADAAPGTHTSTIDTTQFNVLTFTVSGGGGGGGGSDSRGGGKGSAGSQVAGLVQVGPPYASVAITNAGGGTGSLGSSGGALPVPGVSDGKGGPGNGAGGDGGGNINSGGGGGGGGGSAINIAGTSVWIRAGGGGGGGGGSTWIAQRPAYSYNGFGMNADQRYASPVVTNSDKTVTNPAINTLAPSTTLDISSASCASAGVGVNGLTNVGYPASGTWPALPKDGGGGGGNGGSYANTPSTLATTAAVNGQDGYWVAEGGLTGGSCAIGALENLALNIAAGGAGGTGSVSPSVAGIAGGAGAVTLTYSYDPKRVPTIPTISPDGKVTITPPVTLPPGNTPKSYDVTCTSATGATASGSGPAPGPIQLSPALAAGETYTCTTVAQLQDGTGTPTIKTLPSPPTSVAVPLIKANDDSATTTPNTPVTIDVAGNDTVTNTTIDPTKTTVVAQPPNGTATVNADGSITYTPKPGFTGNDVFTYQICNAQGLCNPAKVTVTVQPATPPVTGGGATAVPTLNEWGVIALGLLTAMFGMRKLRRRQNG